MSTQYRIGAFALAAGVPARTLRFYDQIGLLRPARMDPRTRYRLYEPRQLRELAIIVALREAGVPLAEIRRLQGRAGFDHHRRQVLEGLRTNIGQTIARATESLQWIDYLLDQDRIDGHPVPVVIKHRPSVAIASIRSQARSYEAIGCLEKELLDALPNAVVGATHGTLWHRCSHSGCIEGEPFITLRRRVAPGRAYSLGQLPPATLACAYCEADDESADRTYRALGAWMRIKGYTLAGPTREISHPQLLEIQFPLRPLAPQ